MGGDLGGEGGSTAGAVRGGEGKGGLWLVVGKGLRWRLGGRRWIRYSYVADFGGV